MDRYFGTRRIPDQIGNKPSRLADNPPDHQQPSIVPLKDAAVKLSGSDSPHIQNMLSGKQKKVTSFWPFGDRVQVYDVLTPTTKKPLLSARYMAVAGGRTIGGGTSREAIRRAKKKQGRRA